MINLIYRGLLTVSATSWLIVIYGIKDSWHILNFSRWEMAVLLLMVPVCLTLISIFISRWLGKDAMGNAKECELADSDFLPVYLGYFFVALSINDCFTMVVVYAIVFIFTGLTQALYFNPLFLLFGYHFYHVTTQYGTRVFVAVRGKVIRNVKDIDLSNLKRVNDMTYIAAKGAKR